MSAAGGGFPPSFPPGAPGQQPGFAPPQQPQQGFAPPQQGFAPPQAGFAPPQQGFAPGAPMPGYQPAAAPPVAGNDFVLVIAPDPTWQPMDTTDTLEKDGFYMGRIVGEKVRDDGGKLQVIMTLELLDEDVPGKKISRFMQDPRATKGDTWWQWRGLIRSITGTVQHAQQGMTYTPGAFHNQVCYVKTEAYLDKAGQMRTGIAGWSTREEWEEARKMGRHRWPAKPPTPSAGVGALPGGTPTGFGLPGAPGAALPGAPSLPGAPVNVPQPAGAPMQQAPQPMQPQAAPAQGNPFAAPPPAQSMQPAPAAGWGAPPAPGPAAAPTAWGAPPPAAAAPVANPFAGAPPPANGVPQPNAAAIAGSFPGAK